MAEETAELHKFLPADLLARYEPKNYRCAAQILATSCPTELAELVEALRSFSLTIAEIRKPGGNESDIPKKIANILRPKGWLETRIKGDLHVTKTTGYLAQVESKEAGETTTPTDAKRAPSPAPEGIIRRNFLDGHLVDFVKGRVAFDVEWNSKDQTFDRDLFAFRAFHECDLIDAGVILTRSADLNEVFDKLGAELDTSGKPRLDKKKRPKMLKTKYGASTTWMGKLLYRLEAGRQGGCPVLALGITRKVISDWKE